MTRSTNYILRRLAPNSGAEYDKEWMKDDSRSQAQKSAAYMNDTFP